MLNSDLEGHHGAEDELVALEQPAGGIHVHGVGDAVDQVDHALGVGLRGLGAVDGLVEHHAERLGEGNKKRGIENSEEMDLFKSKRKKKKKEINRDIKYEIRDTITENDR